MLEGNDSVLMIYHKCYTDLQEYCQELKDKAALVAAATANKDLNEDLNTTLCKTSRQQLPTQAIRICRPVQYYQVAGTYTPFGNPLTLNSQVAVTATLQMQPQPTQPPHTPWSIHRRVSKPSVFTGFQKKCYCSTCGYPRGGG